MWEGQITECIYVFKCNLHLILLLKENKIFADICTQFTTDQQCKLASFSGKQATNDFLTEKHYLLCTCMMKIPYMKVYMNHE